MEYVTYAKDEETTLEPGLTLGGPIKKDKAWFFIGYNPSFNPLDRTVTSRADGVARTKTQKNTRQNLTANITSQFNEKTRARLAFTSSGNKQEGRLQLQDGTSSNTANYDINDITPERQRLPRTRLHGFEQALPARARRLLPEQPLQRRGL